MQHRHTGKILSRTQDQRRALLKTLLGSLVVRERMTTTLAKARECKRLIDPLVNRGKVARTQPERKVAALRLLKRALPREAAEKLISDFAQRFETRRSGYVRVTKLERRLGDGAEMAVIEFV